MWPLFGGCLACFRWVCRPRRRRAALRLPRSSSRWSPSGWYCSSAIACLWGCARTTFATGVAAPGRYPGPYFSGRAASAWNAEEQAWFPGSARGCWTRWPEGSGHHGFPPLTSPTRSSQGLTSKTRDAATGPPAIRSGPRHLVLGRHPGAAGRLPESTQAW